MPRVKESEKEDLGSAPKPAPTLNGFFPGPGLNPRPIVGQNWCDRLCAILLTNKPTNVQYISSVEIKSTTEADVSKHGNNFTKQWTTAMFIPLLGPLETFPVLFLLFAAYVSSHWWSCFLPLQCVELSVPMALNTKIPILNIHPQYRILRIPSYCKP